MKKLIFIIAILLISTIAYAQQWATSSGEQTADSAIYAKPCAIAGVTIITSGSSDAKLILYDNASAASGTVRYERTVISTNHGNHDNFSFPAECFNGVYADITGTGASYVVEYVK